MALVLTDEQKMLCAQLARQNPRFVELLDALRQDELEHMAKTNPDLFRTFQGRVQMLTELRQHIKV